MARPTKCRRICSKPMNVVFAPEVGGKETIIMGMDEYEAIRLIDHEGLNQEECARQMNVARPTITLIYENARSKIADALVTGKTLMIDGGNVSVCPDSDGNCCGRCGKEECHDCHRQCHKREKNNK